ncbi:pentapeptide repeat-containing protein [Hyphomicrobium sp.]|uniref:pentapeptide repeat-containing protein n=1 Tax=Hyphomicrobium sp. TaxID=82 RepID=UPI002E303203|nr:pentapeptide repeat-containing protein [Hyphomicrobium sp.]HEX2843468.1 pentapeptide repeat-containing protein [Hyphomicrobium sp.]
MTDLTRGAPEGETPVNPYSLLEAVNHSSDTAHTGWLIFLAIMAYLMIAVAGVTHKDLLLETPVSLPILQVNIQLKQFFQFAPIVLVLMHLGVVSQLTLLARETLEFDYAIRLLEATDKRTHPLRLELNNFFFVQAIAGPYRSRVMSAFLHGMSWLTLVVLPVVLLIYIQVVFLPYHDVAITWTHRIALLVDIAILISIGLFLMRAETSFKEAFLRTTSAHPLSFVSTIVVLLLVAVCSFFFATIPGETLDRWTQRVLGFNNEDETGRTPQYIAGYTVPLLTFGSDGSLLGVFKRNLEVIDTDLVSDKDLTPGEPSLNLRDRDLRFAKLDRSDLHQADFTGADLRGASLVGTDLRGVWMQCADVTQLILTEDREAANCTTARRAVFTRARLDGAHMTGVDLRNAKLDDARLDGVELAYSIVQGANFSSARLDKADLTGGVQAQGANFLVANLQGADLTGAQLLGADLSSADLMGAVLSYTHLELANLRDAKLDGASLYRSSLFGADMIGATIAGADLREAKVWKTVPPQADADGFADLSGLSMTGMTEADVSELKGSVERILSRRVKARLAEQIAPLTNLPELANWASSPEYAQWQSLIAAGSQTYPDIYKPRITDYLMRLACRPRWSNGAIATGVARRAQRQEFRGDLVAIYDRLRADDCPASKAITPKTLKDLSAAADIARGG